MIWRRWRTLSAAGSVFFAVKGMVWLALALAAWRGAG